MICPECKQREAEINLTQIINNQKITISLCKQCAEKLGFHSPLDNNPFPLADLLTGMAKGINAPAGEDMAQLVCKTCDLTFEEFARQGRFGCGDCYVSFRPRLEAIMRKIHLGSSLHRGRNPEMAHTPSDSQINPIKEEARVEAELKKAIEAEDFERAAELRDKLKSLRKGITVDKDS